MNMNCQMMNPMNNMGMGSPLMNQMNSMNNMNSINK